jgi:hypothetical protein
MNSTEAKAILKRLGFRVDTTTRYTRALRDFQAAWALGTALKIDGVLGDKTSAALDQSDTKHSLGRADLSKYFSFNEFDCKCGGKYSACRRIRGEGGTGKHTLRTLALGLDEMREKHYKGGMTIVSGYRCTGHNRAVGGASSSQHLFGGAADVAEMIRPSTAKALARFSGLGVDGSSGKIRHVDVRHASGTNPTKGTISTPTQWTYSS